MPNIKNIIAVEYDDGHSYELFARSEMGTVFKYNQIENVFEAIAFKIPATAFKPSKLTPRPSEQLMFTDD